MCIFCQRTEIKINIKFVKVKILQKYRNSRQPVIIQKSMFYQLQLSQCKAKFSAVRDEFEDKAMISVISC